LALIDPVSPKIVRIFDVVSGKMETNQIEHTCEIQEMELN